MRKFKKALAFALASAMVISVVPVSAATTNSAKLGKTTLYSNGTKSYKTTKVTATKKAGYTVKFVSSNKKVATVGLTKGAVTAKAPGTATIKANFYKAGKLAGTKSLKLTVKKAPAATGIKIDKSELMVGETAQMSANKKEYVYFYSADKSVVTVGKTGGKVTAKAGGSTRIAVVNRITGKKKYINVTVLSDAPVATQAGASTITVKNGVSMEGRTITVKRGTTEVKLADKDGVVFADNGKAATIKTAARLTNAEYTVIVKDKDGNEKTSVVKAEAEKVAKINILSDKAAVLKENTADGNGAYRKAQVGYKVENQFGEDITKTTSLNVSGTDDPTLDPTNHKITFTRSGNNSSDYIIGRDIVSVVLVHVETGVTAQATLTISNEPVVETLTYEGIYNADGKALTDDIDLEVDDFYLLFTAIDQYGVKFNDYDSSIKINSGSSVDFHVTIAGGLTNLKAVDDKNAFKKITKDDKEYIGVELTTQDKGTEKEMLKAGTASVMAIASNSGKSVTETITVESGKKARALTVTLPAVVAANEETEFNYTALDAAGNEVTDYDSLKDIEINGTGNDDNGQKDTDALYWKKDAKTGKAKLMFNAKEAGTNPAKNNKAYVSYTFKTVDNKFTTLQVAVSEQARPVAITGLDANVKLTPGTSRTFTLDDLILEDQYGREMSDDNIKESIKAKDEKSQLKAIRVKSVADGEVLKLEQFGEAKTEKDGKEYAKVTFDSTKKDVLDTKLFTIIADDTDKTTSITTTLTLFVGDGNEYKDDKQPLSTTSKDIEFSKVRESSIKDVTVEVADIYAPDDYSKNGDAAPATAANFAKKVVVKAKGAVLSNSQYTVTVEGEDLKVVKLKPNGKPYEQNGVGVYAIQANKDQEAIFDDVDGNKKTVKVTVTLNNGEVATTKDVVISKVKPVVAEFELTEDTINVASGSSVADIVDQLVTEELIDTLEDNYGVGVDGNIVTSASIAYVNSYKTGDEADNTFTITYRDLDDGVKVEHNGTREAIIYFKDGKVSKDNMAKAEIRVGNGVAATVNVKLY